MKTRTPLHCYDLKIKKNYRVLEVGPGHNPSPRSNILVERFIYDNTHRSADVSLFTNQKLINGSGEDLPFKDLEFDYAICKQVIEHSEDPIKFINELTRVSKCGYIEVPSLIGEYLDRKSVV